MTESQLGFILRCVCRRGARHPQSRLPFRPYSGSEAVPTDGPQSNETEAFHCPKACLDSGTPMEAHRARAKVTGEGAGRDSIPKVLRVEDPAGSTVLPRIKDRKRRSQEKKTGRGGDLIAYLKIKLAAARRLRASRPRKPAAHARSSTCGYR